jgi:hypothetical protein
MNSSHHGSDQPLNVSAEAGRRWRSELEFNAIFLASAGERSRSEFGAIVAMKNSRQSGDRPRNINPPFV